MGICSTQFAIYVRTCCWQRRPTYYVHTLFHFVRGRRYLQCFAASSSAAKTRGIGRTRTDDRGRRESEKEANILQLQRRPYKTYPQAERILVRVMWACWNCPPFEREREYCGVCYRVTIGTKAVWMEAKWNLDKLEITWTAEFINKLMRHVDKTST